MVTVLVFGWFALLPDEYAQLGKHILGGSTFISNFILYFESGYWDTASNYKPLLHLWSLGVEEQFYIIFPVMLFVLYKLGLRRSLFIALLFIISFALNLYYYKADMTLDFYMPFTRFWELMAGSLIALYHSKPHTRFSSIAGCINAKLIGFLFEDHKPNINLIKHLLSFLGFIALIAAVIVSREGRFPGGHALLPIFGASMFILAGSGSILNRCLFSLKPIVFIGLISYPLYLWHWSLISYARIITGDDISAMPIFKWILIAIAVLLSILTYFFIERPIRFGKNRRGLKAIVLVVLLAIIGGLGIAVYQKKGIDDRWVVREMGGGNRKEKLAEMKIPPSISDISCLERYGFQGFRKGAWFCELTDVNGSSTTAIVGDSHAMAIYDAVKTHNAKYGINTVLLAQHGAANPIENVDTNPPGFVEGFSDQVFRAIQRDTNIKKVFIVIATDLHSKNPNQLNAAKLQSAIDRMSMNGREIFIVAQHPFLPQNRHIKEYLFAHPLWKPYNNLHYQTKLEVLKNHTESYKMLTKIKGATIIYTIDAFCPVDQCLMTDNNGLPLYFDAGHLSINAGGNFLIEKALKSYLDKR